MPNITAPALSFPAKSFPTQQAGAPVASVGELGMGALLGKYATLVKAGKVFYTSAIVTAPVIFTTAAQLGPVLWNKPGSNIDAYLLAVSVGSPTTATSVPGAVGWMQNVQSTQPTATITAITAVNAYAGGGPSQLAGVMTLTGNVGILPTPIFLPMVGVNTGAITTQVLNGSGYVDVGGMLIVSPGNMGCLCANATLTSGVFTLGLMWAELAV
jgi:hypothetical protein